MLLDDHHEPTETAIITTFLTTEEVAAVLRTKPASVRYWRTTGYGPKGTKIGKRVLYPQTEVETWIGRRIAEARRA